MQCQICKAMGHPARLEIVDALDGEADYLAVPVGNGTCKAGTQTCSNNAWGACSGQVDLAEHPFAPEQRGQGLEIDVQAVPAQERSPVPVGDLEPLRRGRPSAPWQHP